MPDTPSIIGLALAILIPLSPASDQTELTTLIARRVDAVVDHSWESYEGRAWRWSGAECQSLLEVARSADHTFSYAIDWASQAVVLGGEGKSVSIRGLALDSRIPSRAAVTLRFVDDGSAVSARRALARLQAACRPQR